MKLVRTAIGCAVIGLASMAATAETITPPSGVNAPQPLNGNGGLTLYAYNSSASLSVYLGLDLDGFLVAAASPASGRHIDFGVLPGWSVFQGATDVVWHVTAGDTSAISGANGKRIATTADEAVDTSMNNNAVNSGSTHLQDFVGQVNTICAGLNPCQTTNVSSNSYAGKLGPQLNDYIGGGTGIPFANITTLGDSMYFYLISGKSGGGTTGAQVDLYQNTSGAGLFKLALDGTLTWDQVGEVSAVPLPAAAWLLLSGLAGFGVVGRRRSTDSAAA
jgi:hypothetical protein